MKKLSLVILIVAIVSLTTVIQSNALTISATERGAYSSSGVFGTGESGTATGNYTTGVHMNEEYRSFFNFDLSSISNTITSATLHISLDGTYGSSPATIETLGIFDYTGSISDLIGNTGGVAAFTDLGTGILYGSGSASTDATTGTMSIAVNASGLSDINAAIGGYFAIGGALISLSGSYNEYLFGSSIGTPPTLFALEITTVPEPATMLLIGFGLLGLLGLRRKE